jgi:hypothetical protein
MSVIRSDVLGNNILKWVSLYWVGRLCIGWNVCVFGGKSVYWVGRLCIGWDVSVLGGTSLFWVGRWVLRGTSLYWAGRLYCWNVSVCVGCMLDETYCLVWISLVGRLYCSNVSVCVGCMLGGTYCLVWMSLVGSLCIGWDVSACRLSSSSALHGLFLSMFNHINIFEWHRFTNTIHTYVRGSNPGGCEIFRTRPDRPWGPPSLLYSGYRVSFQEVKRPGSGVDHPPHLAPRLKKE